ncbi:MAG: serine protease [Patescibacteria group bacterium]
MRSSSFFCAVACLVVIGCGGFVKPLLAQDLPFSSLQAVVWVQCGDRQGSGSLIHADGYVLTNAHVAINIETGALPSTCVVGLIDKSRDFPKFFYRASLVRYGFDEKRGYDFAILQMTRPITANSPEKPFPFLKTHEFSETGQYVAVAGYAGESESLAIQVGAIRRFDDGYIQTSAEIFSGNSGGAGLNADAQLIGMPTRIVTITSDTGDTKRIEYELADIRAVMLWLDTFGTNEHDKYFTHVDPVRYHQNAVFINQGDLACEYAARTILDSAVSCLLPGSERMVFPNLETFSSWYPDFKHVLNVPIEFMGGYRLSRNVTYKPGTLVKSQTAPSVYVVVDAYGTMRWIPTEARAIALWGPNWASLVHDIPDEFWTNYSIGPAIE